MLAEPEWHGQRGMQEPKEHPRAHRHAYAEPQRRALVDGHPAREGADHHDPFDPEVQNARALADDLAHGGENQWRGDAHRGGPEAGREQDIENVHQPRTTLTLVSRIARTMNKSAIAISMSAI